jgi:hypothetical protein
LPTICSFYGILIRMYFNDHEPPHFHTVYAEHKAKMTIDNFEMISGQLPKRAFELVCDWAELHQHELTHNWELCQNKSTPLAISPLK